MKSKNLFAAVLLLLVCLPGPPAFAQEDAGDPLQLPSQVLDPEIGTDELALRLIPLTKDGLAALAPEWLGIVQIADALDPVGSAMTRIS